MALGNPQQGIQPVSFEIDHAAFSLLPGAVEAAKEGFLPGGLRNNREFIGDCAEFDVTVPQANRDLLFDPQTSGGLLVSIDPKACDAAVQAFLARGMDARRVGTVLSKRSPLLFVK
jgi:selenide,water dikinase